MDRCSARSWLCAVLVAVGARQGVLAATAGPDDPPAQPPVSESAPAQPDAGDCRTGGRGKGARRRPGQTAHRGLRRPDRHLPVHQQRRRSLDEVRLHPVRRPAAGQHLGNPSQRGILQALHPGGRPLPGGAPALPEPLGLLRDGLQREHPGQRGGHEHERGAAPPQCLCRGPVPRLVLHGVRTSVHADDARQGPVERLAVGLRAVPGGGYQLPGGDGVGPLPAGPPRLASIADVQLGRVRGEPRAADWQRTDHDAGLLRRARSRRSTTRARTSSPSPT